jgi:hypothetical protein
MKYVFISITILSLIVGCKNDEPILNESNKNQTQYRITQGACGSVIYQEKIGTNFESAYNELEKRETEYFSKYCPDEPCYDVELDYYQIKVVDENNIIPREQFFAIRVLNKHTNMLLHSVSEVITNNGNLYKISWCLD